MTPISNVHTRGINETGSVVGGTDTPWGKTQQGGVVLQFGTTTVDLQSAQAQMLEESGLLQATIEMNLQFVEASLELIQRLFGIPSSQHSGDLSAATPTAESLEIREGDLDSRTEQLYVLGPGPVSTRRVDAFNARLRDMEDLALAADSFMEPAATWGVLAPDSGPALTFTDQN